MTSQLSELRVLVVDDSRSMRRIVRQFLGNNGITKIAEAGNGQVAMELVQFQPLDMIVSDLNMPVMDGMEFLKNVKADPEFQTIPFIMLTVEAVQKTMNQALEIGADAYIVKPIDKDKLIEEIKQIGLI